MTCSLSAKLGFVRRMASWSVASSWFALDSTWSLNQSMKSERNTDAMSTGRISRRVDTPLALSAVISFSDDSRLNAYRTATSTDIGSVSRSEEHTSELQ